MCLQKSTLSPAEARRLGVANGGTPGATTDDREAKSGFMYTDEAEGWKPAVLHSSEELNPVERRSGSKKKSKKSSRDRLGSASDRPRTDEPEDEEPGKTDRKKTKKKSSSKSKSRDSGPKATEDLIQKARKTKRDGTRDRKKARVLQREARRGELEVGRGCLRVLRLADNIHLKDLYYCIPTVVTCPFGLARHLSQSPGASLWCL